MDWRKPIEQHKPVASPSATSSTQSATDELDFAHSDEYRRAGSDPEMLELALQASALREHLRREGRKL